MTRDVSDAEMRRREVMEEAREDVRRDTETVMLAVGRVVDRLTRAPFGTQRRHASSVVGRLEDLRVDLGNLLCEADDAFRDDETAFGSRRRI